MSPLSRGIRRMCVDYAVSMRIPANPTDFTDDAFTREFIARHISIGGLRHHYLAGSLTLAELEQCADLVLRGIDGRALA